MILPIHWVQLNWPSIYLISCLKISDRVFILYITNTRINFQSFGRVECQNHIYSGLFLFSAFVFVCFHCLFLLCCDWAFDVLMRTFIDIGKFHSWHIQVKLQWHQIEIIWNQFKMYKSVYYLMSREAKLY